MKQLELLAPAGTKEAFIGAINAGANAIYLAGKKFGARTFADNFTLDEIIDMIAYAHLRGVLVYVTVNTLIYEEEINDVFAYTDQLVQNHVDALIVQDLGLIKQFCERYPDTEIHASTQMNVFNIPQLEYLKSIGVSRVILARETSIDMIKKMKANVEIDLEVFIHGALCVSYSGNCLMSAMNGGRSGNRGACAQPCRLPYRLLKDKTVIEEEAYLLSTKDLMTLDSLKSIMECGVCSLKIEGRMRRPAYVIQTVLEYRQAMDAIYHDTPHNVDKAKKNLKRVFNRSFTKGYLNHEKAIDINQADRPNHMGIPVGEVLSFFQGKAQIRLEDTLHVRDGIRVLGRKDIGGVVNRILKQGKSVIEAKKGEVITLDFSQSVTPGSAVVKTMDFMLEQDALSYLKTTFPVRPVTFKIHAMTKEALSMIVHMQGIEAISIQSDFVIEPARNQPITKTQIIHQLSKLGETPFFIDQIVVNTDEKGFIPNKILNQLRRDAVQQLEQSLLKRKSKRVVIPKKPVRRFKVTMHPQIHVSVETKVQCDVARSLGVASVYGKESLIDDSQPNEYLMINRIWYRKDIPTHSSHVVIRDYGMLPCNKAQSVIADWTFNCTNTKTVETLLDANVERITLSLETTFDHLKEISKSVHRDRHVIDHLEKVVYGKPDVMLSKYCPIAQTENKPNQYCDLCQEHLYQLQDRRERLYTIKRDGYCNVRLIHPKPINEIQRLKSYLSLGIKHFRIMLTDEDEATSRSIIKDVIKQLT